MTNTRAEFYMQNRHMAPRSGLEMVGALGDYKHGAPTELSTCALRDSHGAMRKTAVPAVFLVLGLLLLAISLCAARDLSLATPADKLEQSFANPPPDARSWVYWFWVDGNVTREGITADLEAIERAGLGGVLLLDVAQEIPSGPVRFGSAEWRALFKHAVREATRLGLEVSLHNSAGYTGSGGPWITPDFAMQKLVFSHTNLTGPIRFSEPLPSLTKSDNPPTFAVIAFPSLPGEGAPVPGFSPKLTASGFPSFPGRNLLDNNPLTSVEIPAPKGRRAQDIQIKFEKPFAASRLILRNSAQKQSYEGVLEVSENGRSFRQVRGFQGGSQDLVLDFQMVSAQYYRLRFTGSAPGLEQLRFSELQLAPIYRLEHFTTQAGMGHLNRATPQGKPPVPESAAVPLDSIVDLTSLLEADGSLHWEVPTGNWTVLRSGYMPTGKLNHPAREGGVGLECDKLSREAIEKHFQSFLGPLIDEVQANGGTALSGVHVDSWEVGFQNWTAGFAKEFRERRGYDPIPYLPTCTGRIVGSQEISERFLSDLRRTIADLVAAHYAGGLGDLVRQKGLKLSIQGYGGGPFDDLLYASRADVPMTEFWNGNYTPDNKPMSSVAHTYGMRLVAAEAFTSFPEAGKWQNHPFSMKPLGDWMLCEGVNRFVFHRYAHQPWTNRAPGMTMGAWGTHYERTVTWWEQSKPWHDYLARSQFLLQSGQFVGDVCYLTDENAFTQAPGRGQLEPRMPDGFDFDLATPEVVLDRMTVRNGLLTLPGGMEYRVLVLPPTRVLTPNLLRKVTGLVRGGATVVGPRTTRAPGLAGFPGCDDQVRQLASELWGNCDGKTITEHSFGQGKVIWGKPLAAVLKSLAQPPDFAQNPRGNLRWIHRRMDAVDLYFVANPNSNQVSADCEFRIESRIPELWHPDSGKTQLAPVWQSLGNRTRVRLNLDPSGSVFVLFREPVGKSDPIVATIAEGSSSSESRPFINAVGEFSWPVSQPGLYQARTASGRLLQRQVAEVPRPIELGGEWTITFPPGLGAPDMAMMEALKSWTEVNDSGIRYFSGTAAYRKSVEIPASWLAEGNQIRLDLGAVQVIAEVEVNGSNLGVLWKPPFQLDITRAARSGKNELIIRVTNLWPNRLIGDEQLPDDTVWRTASGGVGIAPAKWPAWLLEGRPSPTGRIAFSTWKHWKKDSPLIPSGLLGPVALRCFKMTVLEP